MTVESFRGQINLPPLKEKKPNLETKSGLDRKPDPIFLISEPKYPYFDTLFDMFPFKIRKLGTRPSPSRGQFLDVGPFYCALIRHFVQKVFKRGKFTGHPVQRGKWILFPCSRRRWCLLRGNETNIFFNFLKQQQSWRGEEKLYYAAVGEDISIKATLWAGGFYVVDKVYEERKKNRHR